MSRGHALLPGGDGREIDGSGTATARCVLAPNASPMTLDGTNTWVLGNPLGSGDGVVVVDPGPKDKGHLNRIMQNRVIQILLTHGHRDHSAAAKKLGERTGAPVRALDPNHRLGAEGLADGDVIDVAGLEIRVVGTPGHSFDSLCFWLPGDRALLTGDTVLGRGTTMIAPDGDLADYLVSLDRLRDLVGQMNTLLPGHGPLLGDPVATIEDYIAHRKQRLDQIEAAMAAGATTPKEIVAVVYKDVDPTLWLAAEMSVRAQLRYIETR